MRQQSDGNNLPLPPRIAKRSRRGHNSNWRRRPCAFVRFKSRCPLCPRQLMPTANCGLPQSFRPKPLSQFRTFRRSRKKRSTSPFGKGRTHPAFETKYVRIAAATKPALLFSALSSPRAHAVSIIDPAAPSNVKSVHFAQKTLSHTAAKDETNVLARSQT